MKTIENQVTKETAVEAALAGVDYLVRNQITDKNDANCGRYLCQYDYINNKRLAYTTNWTTGVCLECMLIANRLTSNQSYIDSAQLAAEYLASLQIFSPLKENMSGAIREETPQTDWAHPRDALTAAWAMLDFSQYTDNKGYLERSIAFADWFLRVAMKEGYPYWTVRFDSNPWKPELFGSFHSGEAFYFFRLYDITGNTKYRDVACRILDHYNKYHIAPDGKIQVSIDMHTYEPVRSYEVEPDCSVKGWEVMHEYNDDFGALANLAAWKFTQDSSYLDSAKSFLKLMLSIQRDDGGFGPVENSVPSAAGAVMMELTAADVLSQSLASDEQLSKVAQYLLSLQIHEEGIAKGGFRGVDNQTYRVAHCSNSRTTSYSIMGLLRYAGMRDPFFFFEPKLDADTADSLTENVVFQD